jgi:hypothetical protein
VERLEIIEALKHLPTQIEAETAGLSESVLRFRPAEGEWSIKEVVGHARDYAELYQKRFSMIAAMPDPVLPGLPPAGEVESVKAHNYQDADFKALVAEINTIRLKTVEVLMHAVDWTRIGQQPGVGRRSLKQFAERAIDHEANHVAQIKSLKALQGAAAT